MKKTNFLFVVALSAITLMSCQPDKVETFVNPFDSISGNSNPQRNKIVVISDLHLGNDLSYSENVKHLERLKEFLNEVRSSGTIKELVLGGDILDEWYIPTRTDTYGGGTQADFVRKSVAANQDIFDVLNGIIQDGKIKVTYLPGNHDMGFLPENIEIALPGVNQARDEGADKYGVGTYSPDNYSQIAIEHGHRYDFFCAITPDANEVDAPGATLPPGYFFARIAANSFTNPIAISEATAVPDVILYDAEDAEQYSKNVYYQTWKTVLDHVIYVDDNFDDPIITTKVGGYTKTYAVKDILPENSPVDNKITMNLYDGLFTQSNWNTREEYNNVDVMTDINQAIAGSLDTEFIDNQSGIQYFQNKSSDIRIVVFGHTHDPKILPCTNWKGEDCIYVNSGTWEDKKTRDKNADIDQDVINMHFVVIAPAESDSHKVQVELFQYNRGKHLLVDDAEVTL